MVQSGRVTFGETDAIVYGPPAANRVFLMVSGTLSRTTGETAKVHRCEGSSACICRTACKRLQTPLTEVVCCSGMSPRGSTPLRQPAYCETTVPKVWNMATFGPA